MLTGKPRGKESLGRRTRRWENNIRIDLKKISVDMRDWVDSSQDRDY